MPFLDRYRGKGFLSRQRYQLRMFDFRLVAYVIVLATIGVLVINSAADGFARKQLLGLGGALFMMLVVSLIDYKYIAKYSNLLYTFNILVLVAVKLFGINVNGATRWFSLGPFGTLQPSEIGKFICLIVFSYWISEHKDSINSFGMIARTFLIYIIPMILIALEPDLSTTIVFAFLFCVLMFSAELSYKIIGAILGVSVPAAAFLLWYIQQPGQVILTDYQQGRILSFINPSEYALTTYYQQYNSIMAIGSGMLTGKGLNNNTLTSVKGGNFISEPQTDFIFAVLGEELGFIGCLGVISLLLLIVIECLIIAKDARDMNGRLIACGCAGIIAFQSFTNIGVSTGILPNTGLPLPFVSYGLSSLLSNCLCIGAVLNVGLQRNRR